MTWENILKVDIEEAKKLGEEFASEDMEEFDKRKMRKTINSARNYVYAVAHDELIKIRRMADFPQKEKAIQFILEKVEIVKKMSPYRYITGSNDKEEYDKVRLTLRRIMNAITAKREQAQTQEAAYLA
jgi:hypothetical protein